MYSRQQSSNNTASNISEFYARQTSSYSNQNNGRRSQQITYLHQQFQDLKKKIKQVENKNQRIIEKIHKAYNFKKKGVGHHTQTLASKLQSSQQPILKDNYSVSPQYDQYSNASDISQYEYRHTKPHHEQLNKIRGSKKSKIPILSGSTLTRSRDLSAKRKKNQLQKQISQTSKSPQKRSQKISPKLSITNSGLNIQDVDINQRISTQNFRNQQKSIVLNQSMALQKNKQIRLMKQLQALQQENYSLKGVKQRFKGYAQSTKIILENSLEHFIENIVRRFMLDIQRGLKKNEAKLINTQSLLKQMQDQRFQASRSYQMKRRLSGLSATVPKSNSNFFEQSDIDRSKLRRRQKSRSITKGKQSRDNSVLNAKKKAKQFQQIATKYQQIIKQKSNEIEKINKQLKNKQKSNEQLTMTINNLNRQLRQLQSIEKIAIKPLEFTHSDKQHMDEDLLISNLSLKFSESKTIQNYRIEKQNLQKMIASLQETIQHKQNKINSIENQLSIQKQKNKMLYEEYQENITKNKKNKSKNFQALQIKNIALEKEIISKNQQLKSLQQKLVEAQKQILDEECKYYGMESKIKTLEQLSQMKQKKIQELQKILATDINIENNEKSMLYESSEKDYLNKVKEQIELLEEQLENQRRQNIKLKKQTDKLQQKIQLTEKTVEKIRNESEKEQQNLLQQIQMLKIKDNSANNFNVDSVEDQEQKQRLQEQLNQMIEKYTKASRATQNLKNQILQKDSQIIKLQSQVEFLKNTAEQKNKFIEKYRQQLDQCQLKNNQLEKKLSQKQSELEMEKKDNQERIIELEKQWNQFQQEKNFLEMKKEPALSERSEVVSYKHDMTRINTQNQYLTQKLRQAQSQIEMLKMMETKIINEYKSNVEKIKFQLKEKNQLLEKKTQQCENLAKTLNKRKRQEDEQNKRLLEKFDDFPGLQLNLNLDEDQSEEQRTNNRIKQQQKIQKLEKQLAEAKENYEKLHQMAYELFDQLKVKEEEKNQILMELQVKNNKVCELQEILQLKQTHLGSGIVPDTSKSRNRESIRSQSSLRYSGASQLKNNDKTIELELSQAGSSYFQNSQIHNVSQIFDREEVPYEKMKIRRKDQIKLFEKTSSYIKALKKTIEEKNKQIRILQKKVESLKQNALIRKNQKMYQFLREPEVEQEKNEETYKDYESQPSGKRKTIHHRKYKRLEHDTNLIDQQNKMLQQQIETLQEQLEKAEQQQNSLVKIKDIYKQQIKQLLRKLNEQTREFEQQIQSQRLKVEESQSIHNIQAIKQLFVKMTQAFATIEQQNGRKKQQKKKQLEEYIKVMSSILKVDANLRDKLLTGIRS